VKPPVQLLLTHLLINRFPGDSTVALGPQTDVATTNITGTGTGLTIDFEVTGDEDPDNPGTYLNKYVTNVTINQPGSGYKNGDIFQPASPLTDPDAYDNIGIVYLNSNKSAPNIPEAYVEVKVLAYLSLMRMEI